MAPLLYHAVTSQGPGVRARAFFNGVPFYTARPQTTTDTNGSQINHCLVPGENTLRLEILEMGEPHDSHFNVFIYKGDDPDKDVTPIHKLSWPASWDMLPPEARVLPHTTMSTFTVEADHPRPVLIDAAKPADIPIEGTPELHQAVLEVHDALARQDGAKLIDALWMRIEDRKRYFGDIPDAQRGPHVAKFKEVFADPWETPPFDLKRLVFESYLDGRVVHVTGVDGEPAIRGKSTVNEMQSFETDLTLVRHEGRWRTFR